MRAFLSIEIDGQLPMSHKIQMWTHLHPLKTRLTHRACGLVSAGTFATRASILVVNDDPMRVFASRLSDECAKGVR
jgi:hypothetical protein